MKDFYKGQIYNADDDESFAIEPEVNKTFFKTLNYNDFTCESSNITELTKLHHKSIEEKERIYTLIKEYYKDRFPVGADGLISGGTHFVLFGEYEEYLYNYKEIKNKILNCPLHLKINKEGSIFYGRKMGERSTFYTNKTKINYGDKHNFISLKSDLYSNGEECDGTPIEFRCNNVFDERLLGYYQGILLAVKNNIKFKTLNITFRDYARFGDVKYYSRSKTRKLNKMIGYTIEENDKKILIHNIDIIIDLLEANNLHNSATMLKEYLKEYNII